MSNDSGLNDGAELNNGARLNNDHLDGDNARGYWLLSDSDNGWSIAQATSSDRPGFAWANQTTVDAESIEGLGLQPGPISKDQYQQLWLADIDWLNDLDLGQDPP